MIPYILSEKTKKRGRLSNGTKIRINLTQIAPEAFDISGEPDYNSNCWNKIKSDDFVYPVFGYYYTHFLNKIIHDNIKNDLRKIYLPEYWSYVEETNLIVFDSSDQLFDHIEEEVRKGNNISLPQITNPCGNKFELERKVIYNMILIHKFY